MAGKARGKSVPRVSLAPGKPANHRTDPAYDRSDASFLSMRINIAWATERLGARPARAARVAVGARSGVSVAAQTSLFLRRRRDSFPPGTRAAQLARPAPPTNVIQTLENHGIRPNTREGFPTHPHAPPIHARSCFTKASREPIALARNSRKPAKSTVETRCNRRSGGLKLLSIYPYQFPQWRAANWGPPCSAKSTMTPSAR